MDDDGAPRLPHGGRQRFGIDRFQPAQVQYLDVDPVFGGQFSNLQASGHHGTPRHEGEVPAFPGHPGAGEAAAVGRVAVVR